MTWAPDRAPASPPPINRVAVTIAIMPALDAAVTRQSRMVACIDDCKMMMLIVLRAVPLLLLSRRPAGRRQAGAAALE